MARFRYRLQAALEHASLLERVAALNVAAATAALDDELGGLAHAERALDAAGAKLHVTGTIAGFELGEFGRHLEYAERQIVRAKERVAGARRRLAQARAELAPLAQRRSALERHRERKLEEHRLEEDRAEAAELDETNILRGVTKFA